MTLTKNKFSKLKFSNCLIGSLIISRTESDVTVDWSVDNADKSPQEIT
jgi:hypothetical protein